MKCSHEAIAAFCRWTHEHAESVVFFLTDDRGTSPSIALRTREKVDHIHVLTGLQPNDLYAWKLRDDTSPSFYELVNLGQYCEGIL